MSDKEKHARQIFIWPFGVICLVLIVALTTTVSPTYWIVSLLWTVGWLAFFGIMAARQWLPSTPDEEEFKSGKFCEHYEAHSRVKQPINTWSNLGFMAAGLLIVLIAGSGTTPAPNPMADPQSLVPLAYGLVVIFLGPGSMLFHASGKKWAGWFDSMSIFAWAGFGLSYTASRLLVAWLGWPMTVFWIIAGVIIGAIGVFTAVQGLRRTFRSDTAPSEEADSGPSGIILIAGLWIAIELIVMVMIWIGHGPGFTRGTSWFIGALTAYAAAFVCWLPSTGQWDIFGTNKLWCDPKSTYQGHAFWHLFSAIGALFLYLHFASEIPL